MDNLKDKIEQNATLNLKTEKTSHQLIGQFDTLKVCESLTFEFLYNGFYFKYLDFQYDIEFTHSGFIISNCIFYEDITISALCSSITFESCIFKKSLNIKLYEHNLFSEEYKKI